MQKMNDLLQKKSAKKEITTNYKKVESTSKRYYCLASDDQEDETVDWEEHCQRLENKQSE